MKGTEKIIAHIQADAQAKADAILAQAEQQCASIREDYDKQAAECYAERIRAGVRACQDQADSRQRIEQMEARKTMLAVKQEMVEESFKLAQEKLLKLPKEAYTAFLAKLAARASTTGDEEIILNAADRVRVGKAVVAEANKRLDGGKLKLSDRTGDFAGGVLLHRGNIEVNCTVELLLELCRGDMAAELAAVLFD